MKLRLATRGSDLARYQAEEVAKLLTRVTSAEVAVETLSTRGDREVEVSLPEIGGEGLFTAEIDRALVEMRADLAVHSLKDLPVQTPKQLMLAAVLPRGPIEDALVSHRDVPLEKLAPGARVGTSSPRRRAFLLAARPDLEIVNLRGNVPTRIKRVVAGDLDATLLARAGLVRLGLEERITQLISPPRLLPAPGQGAIAITVRANDSETAELVSTLNDETTRLAVEAERQVLAELGGGCSMPLGTLALYEKDRWHLSSILFSANNGAPLRDERHGSDPLALAGAAGAALRELEALA